MILIKFVLVMGVFVGLALLAATMPAQYELTKHLDEVRPGAVESRAEIWYRLESNLRTRNKQQNDGTDWYAASCMMAEVKTEGSNRLGEPNPHFKLAACKSGICDYAIIGVVYDEPAIVTTRAGVPYAQFRKDAQRDLCITVPVDDVLSVLNGRMPPQ